MANILYPKGKEAFLAGSINLSADNIKAVLVDLADYTYSAAHDYLDDVPSGARVATSPNLSGKSITNGVFDASDITFSSVSGDQSEAMILYKDSGSAATSPLIAYIDTATGLPVTPAGSDVNVIWDNGANKIFAL